MTNEQKTIKNRHELAFFYETTMANPNGDPGNENRLRKIGNKAMVTPERIKRTIRDYLDVAENKNPETDKILVKTIEDDEGNVIDAKKRFGSVVDKKKNNKEKKEILMKKFIDIRMFGMAIKAKITGPVQIGHGLSLHDIEEIMIHGKSVFSSGDNKKEGTFTNKFITPYGFIGVNGVVDEKRAQETGMTKEDFEKLKEGLWEGTRNLRTSSKNQKPRILIDIKYKDGKNHINGIKNYVKLERKENIEKDKFITNINQIAINFKDFINRMENYKDRIEKINIKIDRDVEYKNLKSNKIKLAIEEV